MAALVVDPARADELFTWLQASPQVQGVDTRQAVLRQFQETTAGVSEAFAGILIFFAICIASGVVYNTARVLLSERAWELATLRILGFSRGEVFRVLGWELGLQTAPALLPGCLLGVVFITFLMQMMPMDGIRFPVIITLSSFALSILIVSIAGIVSALLIRRRINRLDMIGVLKTRE